MGFYEFLVTNNYMLLLSWIAYIILITTPFPRSHFALYFHIHNFYSLFVPYIFSTVLIVLRKSNIRRLFMNLHEWKCVHHKGWCYSLIQGGCLAKRTSRTKFYSGWHKSTLRTTLLQRDSIALWDCSKLIFILCSCKLLELLSIV